MKSIPTMLFLFIVALVPSVFAADVLHTTEVALVDVITKTFAQCDHLSRGCASFARQKNVHQVLLLSNSSLIATTNDTQVDSAVVQERTDVASEIEKLRRDCVSFGQKAQEVLNLQSAIPLGTAKDVVTLAVPVHQFLTAQTELERVSAAETLVSTDEVTNNLMNNGAGLSGHGSLVNGEDESSSLAQARYLKRDNSSAAPSIAALTTVSETTTPCPTNSSDKTAFLDNGHSAASTNSATVLELLSSLLEGLVSNVTQLSSVCVKVSQGLGTVVEASNVPVSNTKLTGTGQASDPIFEGVPAGPRLHDSPWAAEVIAHDRKLQKMKELMSREEAQSLVAVDAGGNVGAFRQSNFQGQNQMNLASLLQSQTQHPDFRSSYSNVVTPPLASSPEPTANEVEGRPVYSKAYDYPVLVYPKTCGILVLIGVFFVAFLYCAVVVGTDTEHTGRTVHWNKGGMKEREF